MTTLSWIYLSWREKKDPIVGTKQKKGQGQRQEKVKNTDKDEKKDTHNRKDKNLKGQKKTSALKPQRTLTFFSSATFLILFLKYVLAQAVLFLMISLRLSSC